MSGYLITADADLDLEQIWQYVATHSGVSRADKLDAQLHAAMHRLGRMPGMGHQREDVADEALRFFRVHRFLIVYRPQTRPVQIIRVIHGARDVGALLSDF